MFGLSVSFPHPHFRHEIFQPNAQMHVGLGKSGESNSILWGTKYCAYGEQYSSKRPGILGKKETEKHEFTRQVLIDLLDLSCLVSSKTRMMMAYPFPLFWSGCQILGNIRGCRQSVDGRRWDACRLAVQMIGYRSGDRRCPATFGSVQGCLEMSTRQDDARWLGIVSHCNNVLARFLGSFFSEAYRG